MAGGPTGVASADGGEEGREGEVAHGVMPGAEVAVADGISGGGEGIGRGDGVAHDPARGSGGEGGFVEVGEEEVAPEGEPIGGDVELDGEEIGGSGRGGRVGGEVAQAGVDAGGAQGRRVAAVAEESEGVAAQFALVAGPEEFAGADNARGGALGREEAVPAAVAESPGGGKATVETEAVGEATGEGPSEASVVGSDEGVEGREAGGWKERKGVVETVKVGEAEDGEVYGAGFVERPAEGEGAAFPGLSDEWAPVGPG